MPYPTYKDSTAATRSVKTVSSSAAGDNGDPDIPVAKLEANSGVDIGDVDVTSVIPGVGATNLGKAEDAAHTSGDVGVMAMSVRKDAAVATSGTDSDYQPLITDGVGRLHVTDEFAKAVEYETVAASQTAQVLGTTGAAGDLITGVLVIPATVSPGNVLLLDNATSITVFTGGTSSVSNLVPFLIPLGIKSVSGAWKITTGANVSVIGMGKFTA